MQNAITYDTQSWTETVSYTITVVNPCIDTALFTTNTTFAAMEYELTSSALTQSFTAVTDTVTNGITTSGSCGTIAYTLATNDTLVGTGMLTVVDLLNLKGIQVEASDEKYLGNYTITVTATMESYPTKTQ